MQGCQPGRQALVLIGLPGRPRADRFSLLGSGLDLAPGFQPGRLGVLHTGPGASVLPFLFLSQQRHGPSDVSANYRWRIAPCRVRSTP